MRLDNFKWFDHSTAMDKRAFDFGAAGVLAFNIRQGNQMFPVGVKFWQRRQAKRGQCLIQFGRPKFQLATFRRKAMPLGLAKCGAALKIQGFDFFGICIRQRHPQPAPRRRMQTVLCAAAHIGIIDQHFIPKNSRVFIAVFQHIIITKFFPKLDPEPVIRLGVTGWWNGFIEPDNPAILGSPADFAFFNAGCRRQDIIGKMACFILEQIDMHQQIKLFKRRSDTLLIGPGHHWIIRGDHRSQRIGIMRLDGI